MCALRRTRTVGTAESERSVRREAYGDFGNAERAGETVARGSNVDGRCAVGELMTSSTAMVIQGGESRIGGHVDRHATEGSVAGGGWRRRIDAPVSGKRWACWTRRSRMASASVGSPAARAGCQASTGSWLTTSVERIWLRSSTTSSGSLASTTLGGVSRKSSSTSRPETIFQHRSVRCSAGCGVRRPNQPGRGS